MPNASDPATRNVIEPGTVNAPEFPPGLSWFNTEAPLAIRELRGKVVLLDFWTHCCINCLHALQDLKRLEQKYRNELVVIGVHAAKFDAEKNDERIREAVMRYGIEHPVVNDSGMRVWQEYAVRAWPTFVLVDPLGKVFGAHSGERIYDLFDQVIGQMVDHHAGSGHLDREPLATRREADTVPDAVLSFPGKVLADERGGRLFIADTNHHRIIVAARGDGTVLDVIGSGEPALADGPAKEASFQRPQGMALAGDALYVADTGNHAIRRVDLSERLVSTVVGDGQQDEDWESAPAPLEGKRLNSPWDLQIAHGVLFVAMAGNHRVFGIDLEGGYIAAHAGSGREDHVDGPLLAAALAQPSGITCDSDSLFVADSETSSVRAVSLDPRGGHVRTVVGRGLFDFGDIDGIGAEVRLQHPTGVAFGRGRLYLADTFNNKIKSISLPNCQVRTLSGSGVAGYRDGSAVEAEFNEPAGLSYAAGTLYVADTNNHAIRTVDIATGAVAPFPLRNTADLVPAAELPDVLPASTVSPGQVSLRVSVALPSGRVWNPDAVSGVTLRVGGRSYPAVLHDGVAETSLEVAADEMIGLEAVAYYCDRGGGACLYYRAARILPLRTQPGASSEVDVSLEAGPR